MRGLRRRHGHALHAFQFVAKRNARARKTLTGIRFAESLEDAKASARRMVAEEYGPAGVLLSVEPAKRDPRGSP